MHKYLHVLFLAMTIALIFGFEYPSIQDYPNWLYHGYVFNEIIFHGNSFGGFFHFNAYIPPNAITPVIIGCTSLIVSPLLAGKIFLLMTAILLYIGSKYYLSVFLKDQEIFCSLVAFYFVFNL